MLSPFHIHEPASIAEASLLLAEHGPEAAIYAGGTELLVIMKERLVHYPHLINIKTIPDLDRIAIEDGALTIGALATHTAIARNPVVREHVPLFAELEGQIANTRVRTAGTIGGNLCFAEPHSDPATLLIALDAEIVLETAHSSRTISLGDFFTGLLETVRESNEVLTEIRIPLPVATATAYERFRTHERPTATVAVAMHIKDGLVSDARIVVGSVCERPVRVTKAERALIGQRPGLVSDEVVQLVHGEIEPTEDGFESSEYKRHLASVLVRRALATATERGSHGN